MVSDPCNARQAYLGELLGLFYETKRWRSGTEARRELTGAYVALEVAVAQSHLGAAEGARASWDHARATLAPLGDPIHNLLLDWYGTRIARAAEGMPAYLAVETELERRRVALDPYLRFKVERLRQVSRLLDPDGALIDPVWLYRQRFYQFPARLDRAATLADPADLAVDLESLLAAATPEYWAAAIRTTLSLVHRLDSPGGLLDRLTNEVLTIESGEQAFMVAHLARVARVAGEGAFARRLADHLENHLDGRAEGGAAGRECALALVELGETDAARRLVDLVAGMASLEALLEIAPAAIATGREADALRWLSDGMASLVDPHRQLLVERLEKICVIARACGWLPWEWAERRLRDLHVLLPTITDSMNANSHFCLAVVQFFDALAVGCVAQQA